MRGIVLLMIIIAAIIVYVIAVPIFLLIFWLINRFLLGGKFRLIHRIVIANALPLLLLGGVIAYSFYKPYSTSIMDNRLEDIGLGIKLPKYKITNYTSAFVGGDDIQEVYTMELKDDNVRLLIPQLDSLCNADPNWTKESDTYIYGVVSFENEVSETFIIKPYSRKAEFVYNKW